MLVFAPCCHSLRACSSLPAAGLRFFVPSPRLCGSSPASFSLSPTWPGPASLSRPLNESEERASRFAQVKLTRQAPRASILGPPRVRFWPVFCFPLRIAFSCLWPPGIMAWREQSD